MLSFVETQRSPGQKAGAITELKMANPAAEAMAAIKKNNSALGVTAFSKGVMPMTQVRNSIARTNNIAGQFTNTSATAAFSAIGRHHRIIKPCN
jgi:hypothetical protein